MENTKTTDRHEPAAHVVHEKTAASQSIVESTPRDVSNSGPKSDTMPNCVNELTALLGNEVVLIPVRTGSKAPLLDGWQNIRVESMGDPEYLANLTGCNIGVVLGEASNGLCAIDIDSDEMLEPFLTLNPALRKTLTTKGKRGAQIWVKVSGAYPSAKKLKDDSGRAVGEWRADGNQSVIHGLHPEGMKYRRLNEASPVVIRFDDILWPANWVLPWAKSEYQKLVEEHGKPFELNGRGGLQLNEYFFVGRFQREYPVLWEPMESVFYTYSAANGLWDATSEDILKTRFGYDLKRAGDDVGIEQFALKRTGTLMTSFVTTLRGFVERKDAFKKGRPVIHVANGMLDLATLPPRLMTFHPDYLSRNLCPIAFDPHAECPKFKAELLGTALDADDIDLLQRWAGSVLLGVNVAQRILLLVGTPNGGKSTLIEIFEKLIGEQNVAQVRTKHLGNRFEFYKFIGKTLLTGKDVSARFLSEDGSEQLKALVGNDLLDAEKKGRSEHFQLRGTFNVAITSNSELEVKLEGDTGAWQRRLILIQYNRPEPEMKIAGFGKQLIDEEGPGILNWMIEGAIKHVEELNATGNFRLTDTQKERVRKLLDQSDSVRLFVQECVNRQEGADLAVCELEEGYTAYCGVMGWRPLASNDLRKRLNRTMQDILHISQSHDIRRNSSTFRGFKNVALKGGL